MASINDVGQQRSGRGGRFARLALIAGIHVALIAAILELTVPPAFEGDPRPFYVRLVQDAPAPAEPQPPATPAQKSLPRPLPQPVLAAAGAVPTAAAFVVPPQPAAPPTPAEPTPTPALVEAHVDADYLDNPKPAYPVLSQRAGEQGTVSLRVHVGVDGQVLALEVAQSSRFPRLDEAARAAVSRWRFVPAHRGDTAVDSWVVVPVSFQLKG